MYVKTKMKENKRTAVLFSAIFVILIFAGIIFSASVSSNFEYSAFADSQALSTPEISTVSNTAEGVRIEWKKADGAEMYRVFYKNALGFWVKIADTDSDEYTWAEAKSGRKYSFTVRCISSDGKSYTSGYDRAGKSITYIAMPKLISVSNTADGVKISWGKVTGAAKYRILYKNSSGDWIKVEDTPFTNYTWAQAESGTQYTFTVRCVSGDGESYTSSYDNEGMSIVYIAAPKLISVTDTEAGVKIIWDKVAGAAKYKVLYKIGSGDWNELANTIFTGYIWKEAARSTNYTFTVRCVGSDLKSWSGYDTVGKALVYSPSLNGRASTAADKYSNCTRYVYGKSAMGNLLESYIIDGCGKNDKTIFMDFAVHGFEDDYDMDGKVLVTLGNELVEYYSVHPELLGDYRLVIVPCANPDGAMYGKNNYRADSDEAEKPFGRCIFEGIDINRDFKSDGFKAVESRALRDLMDTYKPSIYLNFHGWEDSALGDPQLVNVFISYLGLTVNKSYRYAPERGYIISYVNSAYNAKSAIVEFQDSKSVDRTSVINAINHIIFNDM